MSEETEVKRPVGRPRKSQDAAPTEEIKVKRPVGRPRKPRDPAVEAAKEAAREARKLAKLAKEKAQEMNEHGEPFQKVPADCTPLDYMLGVIRGVYKCDPIRAKIAEAAARYVHTATHDGGKKEERERQAEQVARGKYAPGKAPTAAVH